jgi:FKBP-type peptidyl-prolyl cis-trans isomerase
MRRLRVGLRIGLVFAAGVLWAVASVGCTDTPASPTPTPAFSQTDLIVGTGATAAGGASLTVDYTGWLYDPTKPDSKGLQFDTSIGQTPLTFTLGAGQVIQGWEVGVAGMLVGGKRRLIIPPNLAYGDTRKGIVPPNATLVFDITLLGSQ